MKYMNFNEKTIIDDCFIHFDGSKMHNYLFLVMMPASTEMILEQEWLVEGRRNRGRALPLRL